MARTRTSRHPEERENENPTQPEGDSRLPPVTETPGAGPSDPERGELINMIKSLTNVVQVIQQDMAGMKKAQEAELNSPMFTEPTPTGRSQQRTDYSGSSGPRRSQRAPAHFTRSHAPHPANNPGRRPGKQVVGATDSPRNSRSTKRGGKSRTGHNPHPTQAR